MSEEIINTRSWPLVHYVMPEQVPDNEVEQHIAALQAVLDRQQLFVLIFSGVELPRNSAHFFRRYKNWGKMTREAQQRWCCGAVRVEPDEVKRRSFWRNALRYLSSKAVPYPYKVVASQVEAEQQAQCWLQNNH
jgi:hypothetical protein